jgi:hypothetical protein
VRGVFINGFLYKLSDKTLVRVGFLPGADGPTNHPGKRSARLDQTFADAGVIGHQAHPTVQQQDFVIGLVLVITAS